MAKTLFLLSFLFLFGCISYQGKLTTFLDYLPAGNIKSVDEEQSQEKKPAKKGIAKYTKKDGHDVTFARSWSYVLNRNNIWWRYIGVRASITNPNKFFRFDMTVLKSPTVTLYNDRGFGLQTDGRFLIGSRTDYMDVLSIKKKTYFIISPCFSAPVARYDFDIDFGSKLRVNTNIELRTGIGYEWFITYSHGQYDIYVPGGELEDVYLPNNITDDSFLTQINTLDINIEPVHFETSILFNSNEVRLSFGIGAIW